MIIEAREDTITLRGSIRDNIWPAIQAAAALLLENYPTGIIIDCSAITDYTPKGAETFADAFEYISSRNARIVLAALSPELMEIARSVPGVRSQLPLASTVEEARASLRLEELTPQRGRALNAGVVPMDGSWRRAVYQANKLAVGENCEIHLVDLIKVPRTLPIGSPLPDRESAGQARLEEAKPIISEAGTKVFTHVERVRSDAVGLDSFAKRLGADFVVASIDPGKETAPQIDDSEARSLLESATYELSLIRGSGTDPNRRTTNPVVPAISGWQHALGHACRLTMGEAESVTVVCLIRIPRAEPLDAVKPDAEAAAEDCRREAVRVGKRYGFRVNAIVERVRDPVIGFLKMIESQGFDLVVVGVGRETEAEYSPAHAMATALIQNPPCEAVILRMGGEREARI